jgi:peptidoglycan/LPS O-acetylase OafA/YrhL
MVAGASTSILDRTTRVANTPLVRPYMPELDTLRGLAISLVLVYHGFYYTNNGSAYAGIARTVIRLTRFGWAGVNLFFVLSGFLITGILLQARSEPNYYKNFYIHRALRILPAYYALLCVLLALHRPASFVALSAGYMANMAGLFGIPMAYGPLWSLAVEEHYYLLWPMVVKRCAKSTIAAVTGFIVVACPLMRALYFRWGRHDDGLTWLIADGLALGSLIALGIRTRWATRRNAAIAAGVLAAISTATFAVLFPIGMQVPRTALAAALKFVPWNMGFAAVLIVAVLVSSSKATRATRLPVLPFLGEISYGLYLVHVLVFESYDRVKGIPAGATSVLVRFLFCATISVVIASLSRFTYEEMFLRMKKRWT